MKIYCIKCKTKREMQNPGRVYMRDSKPWILGRCPVCSSKVSRLVEDREDRD
jgi:Domain of unknown function (DUF5679)